MVTKIDYPHARKIILDRFKNSEILCAMRMKDGILFSIKPNKAKDYVLDAFFKVTNKGSLEEYSPVMNPSEFKEAMNNVIYGKYK